MPIKFIDSEIWRKERFRKLTPVQKCFVFYLLTTCNHAGICEVDLEAASFIIGEKIENPETFLVEEFSIIKLEYGRKWLILNIPAQTVPVIPEQSVPVIPDESVPPIPGQSVPLLG